MVIIKQILSKYHNDFTHFKCPMFQILNVTSGHLKVIQIYKVKITLFCVYFSKWNVNSSTVRLILKYRNIFIY